MYTPTQLEAIRVFGRKELTEGCLIQQGEYHMNIWCIYEGIYNMKEINSANCMQVQKSDIGEILGHIPHLEDVFRVANDIIRKDLNKLCEIKITNEGIDMYGWRNPKGELMEFGPSNNTFTKIYSIFLDASIPLIEQPESVLIQLLNLFK